MWFYNCCCGLLEINGEWGKYLSYMLLFNSIDDELWGSGKLKLGVFCVIIIIFKFCNFLKKWCSNSLICVISLVLFIVDICDDKD